MGCEPCGTRHDKGEQAEKRDVGSGIDDDQEVSGHGSIVPRAPGLLPPGVGQRGEGRGGRR